MDFKEKYEMYRDDSIGDTSRLQIQLMNNVNESLESLYSNLGVNENTKYLINELLEDKEHLDAYIAANIKRPE